MHASAQSDVMSPGTAALKILASFAAAFGVLGPASPTRCRKDSPNAPSSEISRSRFAANNRKERPLALAHERILPKPSPIMSGQSMHTLQQKYGKFTREWKASAAYKDIFKFFIDTLLKLDTIDIDSCMCLCLGSLSCERNSPGEKEYNRSMSQLVAFESLVELLRTKYTIKQFYIQDPSFNELDMKFLKSLGLTVLETSEPEDYVSTKTFLFTPYGPRDVKTSTIGAAQPALFLGIDLRNRFWCSENGWLTEGSRSRTEYEIDDPRIPISASLEGAALYSFLNNRVMKSLPKSELAEWWHDHFFYYKPASEKELMPISFDVEDEELYSKEEKSAYYESNRSDVIRGTK